MWISPAARLAGEVTAEDFHQFQQLCSQSTDPSRYPLSIDVQQNIPIYKGTRLTELVRCRGQDQESVMEELQRALLEGPGVFVIQGLVDGHIVDGAEEVTRAVRQTESGFGSKSGRRTFSYTEKHAVYNPESFAEYYGNDLLAAVCEAWLGPGYQITAMTNAVSKDDEEKQGVHRDYHLSAQSDDRIHRFPLINQHSSQFLTLQAAIAHTDMPIPCGPTRFLPFSQQFTKGYLAFKRPEYVEYTTKHFSQLPLSKGDAVFFNPATFHQPGENSTVQPRIANLLQVNACWSKPMEYNDKYVMTKRLWPVIKRWHSDIEELNEGLANGHSAQVKLPSQLDALIRAVADDYGYPNRIDLAPPKKVTMTDLVRNSLEDGTSDEDFYAALEAQSRYRRF